MKLQHHAAVIFGGDFYGHRLRWCLFLSFESLHFAERPLPLRMHSLEVGADGLDLESGDRMDEIEPVCADIRHGSKVSTLFDQHTPVVIGRQ